MHQLAARCAGPIVDYSYLVLAVDGYDVDLAFASTHVQPASDGRIDQNPMPDENIEKHRMLPDGRMIKGAATVESLFTRYEERIHISACSLTCNRMLRREFNAMSTKLLLLASRTDKRARIASIIDNLTYEANHLEQSAWDLPAPPVLEASPLPFRLVTLSGRQLIDAMITFDRAMAKFVARDGREAAELHCADFFKFYGKLKMCLFGHVEKKGISDGAERG